MTHYNTLIIGGGPSGTGAGICLQKAGISTCIIDRCKFPREKLCGGLVTRKTKDLLNTLMDDRTEAEIWESVSTGVHKNLKLFNRFDLAVSVEINEVFDTVYRKVYDNYLMDYYIEKGGKLLDGEMLTEVDFNTKTVKTACSGQMEYEYLVAADGANSAIRNRAAYKLSERLFCLEINVDREDFDFEGIGIYFDVIGVGYAWVFPKRDVYCIGIGTLEDSKKDFKGIFMDFLKKIGVRNLEKYPLKGAMIPGGGFLKRPVYKNSVFFVGDAAGFADPLTGEGLYWSMYSGKAAAEAIIESPDAACENYLKKCKPIQNNIRSVSRTRILFHKPLYQFWLKNVKNHPNFVTYFSDNQLSHYTTDQTVSDLLKKVAKRYLKHFFNKNV